MKPITPGHVESAELVQSVEPRPDGVPAEVGEASGTRRAYLPHDPAEGVLGVGVTDRLEPKPFVEREGHVEVAAELAVVREDPIAPGITLGNSPVSPAAQRSFRGNLDDVLLLKRVLSGDDVLALYEASRPERHAPAVDER